MNWQDWLTLSPEAFESRLRHRLDRTCEFGDVVDLYNELIATCDHNARHVAEVAKVIASLMQQRDLLWERLLFLELTAVNDRGIRTPYFRAKGTPVLGDEVHAG